MVDDDIDIRIGVFREETFSVSDQMVRVELLHVGGHLGLPCGLVGFVEPSLAIGAVHLVAELPGENRFVVLVGHARNRVHAGEHVMDGLLEIGLHLRVGEERRAGFAAVGGIFPDAAQVVAAIGRQVEHDAYAVFVGQGQQVVEIDERCLVEFAGPQDIMPRGRFLCRLADRQVPRSQTRKVHPPGGLHRVFQLPGSRQDHPLGDVQVEVVRHDQPGHVGADEPIGLFSVEQLVVLAGDEICQAFLRFGGEGVEVG